jgi:hypothetical protein
VLLGGGSAAPLAIAPAATAPPPLCPLKYRYAYDDDGRPLRDETARRIYASKSEKGIDVPLRSPCQGRAGGHGVADQDDAGASGAALDVDLGAGSGHHCQAVAAAAVAVDEQLAGDQLPWSVTAM